MRYTKYITTLFALIAISACTIADIDNQVVVGGGASNDQIQILGRITRFSDHDVTTRGPKDDAEAKMSSMALAIFPVKEDGSGLADNCVFYSYKKATAELLFTVDRASNSGLQLYNKPYVMYIFCNMPGMENFKHKDAETGEPGTSLEEMLAVAYDVENINIPVNGFPMIGSLGDTFSTSFDRDNQKFILSPTDGRGKLLTPTVDGQTRDLLTIPMAAMFAKVNFSILVDADQKIPDSYAPKFDVRGYTINGIPSTVDFNKHTSASAVIDNETLGIQGNLEAIGTRSVDFTFYLPEQLLKPAKTFEEVLPQALKKGTYSTDVDSDQNGYRDEDEKYHQRYKCKLLGDDQQAMNIVISGTFRDHQNHHWDIDYTIYLGENNTDNFNIRRNYEYNNVVTIRGAQNSSDMSDDQEAISIDHRVNITRTQPGIITLRRETLLDSHFEVRPLRVRKSEEEVAGINAVKVEVVNPTTTNWMRIERSAGVGSNYAGKTNASGQSIYITEAGSSYGKRRYFTYNLVDGKTPGAYDYSLVNSTAVVMPLTEATECCWIYVDECTEIGDAVRSGVIRVTYGSGTTTDNFVETTNTDYPPVEFVINQRKLFQVKYDDPKTTDDENRIYNIEFEEEYLHNFDADDNFGTTDYEGMQWGLPGIQLSYDHSALFFTSVLGLDFISNIINALKGTTPAYYDFYVTSHDADYVDEEQAELHDYKGYDFCTEIIQTVNGGQKDANGTAYDNDPNNNIDILALNQMPKSAIEYCYNKNKRNSEGHVAWQDGTTYNQSLLNWYLPAIDEMEDIMMSTYGAGTYSYARFLDFRNKFYWSSQPSYLKNYARYDQWYVLWTQTYYGDFFMDDIGDARFDISNNSKYANVGGARATSVSYEGSFDSTPSGTNGYYYYYNANDKTPSYSGSYDGKTMNTVEREAGNLPRTSYARVRCVRKSATTTTE